MNDNLFVNLSNMTDEQVNNISDTIKNWMKEHKDNFYVEILGKIWLRKLMNRY
jgi:hypothetical protein